MIMSLIKNYDEYMLDYITENIKNDQTILVLSDKLIQLLDQIKHPISKKMLSITFDISHTNDNFKITLLDVNNKKDTNGKPVLDSISFLTSNKALEMVYKRLNIQMGTELSNEDKDKVYKMLQYMMDHHSNDMKNKSETSLGRIINKLFPGNYDPHKDIEPFVNMYKSMRDKSNFEIVKGKDIKYWYNENNYINQNGTLGQSCMKYPYCSDYLNFYVDNSDKVSMLILKDKDDETKIRGRALLWELNSPYDVPYGRVFMDRIYYTTEHIVDLFKEYAVENGWLYKKEQNMEENSPIIDEKYNTQHDIIVVNDIDDSGWGNYPYMDTLKYFNGESLSNDGKSLNSIGYAVVLTDTDGGTMTSPGNDEDEDYFDDFGDED